MRHKWLSALLVVLFGSFGAIYTWKYDKGFLITALCLGATLAIAGVDFATISACGVIVQIVLLITVLVRDNKLYMYYDKEEEK